MTVYYGTYYGYTLEHHGVKGMKWGVRRYQNEDGTLTEEGKKRYRTYGEYMLSPNGGLTASQRHAVAKRKNETAFKNANATQRAVRTLYAVSTLGTGKALTRFQYRHQVGLNKINKAIGIIGGAQVVAGAVTVNPMLISSGISTMSSAAISRYLNMPLNDFFYEKVYNNKGESVREKNFKK